MIILFEGTPGSGKSYDAVRKILDNLKSGRTVYTNVEGLDGDEQREHIKLYTNLDDYEFKTKLIFLSNDQVKNFWDIAKPGSLIVIDEVQKYFNNRDWQTASNRAFCNWTSTHRHHGYELLLITQNAERIDAAARSLIEWTYRYRKLNMFGSLVKNRYRVDAYSDCEAKGKPLNVKTKSYDKRVFACYSSYVTKDTKELGIMTHVNVLKAPVFFAIPVVLLVFVILVSKSSLASGDLFGAKAVINKSKALQASSVKQPQAQPVIVNNPTAVSMTASSIVFAAPKPHVRPMEKVAAVKVPQKDDLKTPGNSNVIIGIAGAGETVLVTIQDRGVVELSGYKFNDGAICRDDKCYRIGDSLPQQI